MYLIKKKRKSNQNKRMCSEKFPSPETTNISFCILLEIEVFIQMKYSVLPFVLPVSLSVSLRVFYVNRYRSLFLKNGCIVFCTIIHNQDFLDRPYGLVFRNCFSKNHVHTYLCPCPSMLAEDITRSEASVSKDMCIFNFDRYII